MAIVKCISKLFPLLIKSGIIAETNLICNAVLRSKWTNTSAALCSAMIDYALNEVTNQLFITKCTNDYRTIIKVLGTIYEIQDESVCSKFTDILRSHLNFLCQMLSLIEISNDLKSLLVFILRDMYKSLFSNFNEKFDDIIEWDLPENLEQWPSSNSSRVFLLTVYFMQLYSRIIWRQAEILDFLIARTFRRNFALSELKILLHLFPIYSLNQTGQKIPSATHILAQLSSERIDHLKEIITFEKIQMTWIFLYAPLLVKIKTFYLWLSIEKDDTKILPALDASGSGDFLLTILFRNCNVPIISTR
ncbi:uncharacterized protein LOC108743014 isoform X2 [Agrilus planipennis]|nr:uncharacterized protein LOC108743014 isoform X2 [Agrilus planipennis]